MGGSDRGRRPRSRQQGQDLRLGPLLLGRHPPLLGPGCLRQFHDGRRLRARRSHLRRELPPSPAGKSQVRSGESLPREPEHSTGCLRKRLHRRGAEARRKARIGGVRSRKNSHVPGVKCEAEFAEKSGTLEPLPIPPPTSLFHVVLLPPSEGTLGIPALFSLSNPMNWLNLKLG